MMAKRHLTCAIAQLNATVGDIDGNTQRILDARAAVSPPADILLTPEMMLTGYQLDDLLLTSGFFDGVARGLGRLKQATSDNNGAIIVGAPRLVAGHGDGESGKAKQVIYNSVFVFANGKQVAVRDKTRLPLGGVFDDGRNFTAGGMPDPVAVGGVRLGLLICEDFWDEAVVKQLAANGAEVIATINGSPFELGKDARRLDIAKQYAATTGLPIIYANLVGGQDDVVFDGASFAMADTGEVITQLPHAQQAVEVVTLNPTPSGWRIEDNNSVSNGFAPPVADEALLWQAITLGIGDYVRKNNFSEVLVGVSGGIDSAVVATLAADALGADKVHAVLLPSPYTSKASMDDGRELVKRLGIGASEIPIEVGMAGMAEMLDRHMADHSRAGRKQAVGVARENIQSRLRGVLLMALSNMSGGLLLTTGNKSEYASGYATLYGDMCGGYAPLIDVWKTDVFRLAQWRNQQAGGEVIPQSIISKPPSAELRPNQKDSDSLPDYAILDGIMRGLVEEMQAPAQLIAAGFREEDVLHATDLLKRAEFKRRQCAPGPKISKRAFYRDRRFPITSAYDAASYRQANKGAA